MQFGPMRWREAHIGEHIGFGLVHQFGELLHFGPDLIGDMAPLLPGGLGIVLGEDRGDEGGNRAPSLLAGMGKNIAHKVDTAALP